MPAAPVTQLLQQHWRRTQHLAQPTVSWRGRLQLWWHGGDVAARRARVGAYNTQQQQQSTSMVGMWGKLAMAALCFAYSVMTARAQDAMGQEMLENTELNRLRYYEKDFAPSTQPVGMPDKLPTERVYLHHNPVNGLMTDEDNRIFAPDTRAERQRRVAAAVVTDEMLHDAKALLSSARYQHP